MQCFNIGKNANSALVGMSCKKHILSLVSRQSEFAFFGAAASATAPFYCCHEKTNRIIMFEQEKLLKSMILYDIMVLRNNLIQKSAGEVFYFGKNAFSILTFSCRFLSSCFAAIGVCVFRCSGFGCCTFLILQSFVENLYDQMNRKLRHSI